MLGQILQAELSTESAAGLAGFLATLPPALQAAVAEWNLDRLPKDALGSAQETWKGLLRQNIESRIGSTKAKLHDRSLPPDQILEIHKELLDLRRQLQDVTWPDSADVRHQPIENEA